MTDQTYAPNLTGDDAMAFGFLNRAANAIVQASDLSKQLASVSADLWEVTSHADTLAEIKRTQEERIATLEAQLATSLEAEARATATVGELHDVVRQRQTSIDLLDETVADLRSKLAATQTERDDYGLKHMEACDALSESQAKLNAIISAMEKVGFNVSTIVPPEPEPDHRDYAADNPTYRGIPVYPTPVARWDSSPEPEERTPDYDEHGRGSSDPAYGDGPVT